MGTKYPTAQELYEQANEYLYSEKVIRFEETQQCKELFDLLATRSKSGSYVVVIYKRDWPELFNAICMNKEILTIVYGYKVEINYTYHGDNARIWWEGVNHRLDRLESR